jgi:hypothetical protein
MAGVFWLFSSVCILGFAVVWRVLPETKGKTLEDIERDLLGTAAATESGVESSAESIVDTA